MSLNYAKRGCTKIYLVNALPNALLDFVNNLLALVFDLVDKVTEQATGLKARIKVPRGTKIAFDVVQRTALERVGCRRDDHVDSAFAAMEDENR